MVRVGIAILCGMILAGCSHSASPSPLPADSLPFTSPQGTGYQSLHSFAGAPRDGAEPYAGLVALDGELYGTTMSGGKSGVGTIYKMSASGVEHVMYSFPLKDNGRNPESGLIVVDGVLYGTTYGGGGLDCIGGCGTIFKIGVSGREEKLYGFTGSTDGQYPVAGVTAVNGTLYGTTVGGGCNSSYCRGSCNCGTVFAFSSPGKDIKLHAFQGPDVDGAYPDTDLTYFDGALYGATRYNVFEIKTSGAFAVVYRFRGNGDGFAAEGDLLPVNGAIYGTTSAGGTGCGGAGCGTVFKLSTSGKESVLYRFKGGNDGSNPAAGLIAVNGILYGTTMKGGRCNGRAPGCGTIFSLDAASGKEQILYRFKGGKDGEYPGKGDLIDVNGALYGTTEKGGIKDSGTLFKFVP